MRQFSAAKMNWLDTNMSKKRCAETESLLLQHKEQRGQRKMSDDRKLACLSPCLPHETAARSLKPPSGHKMQILAETCDLAIPRI